MLQSMLQSMCEVICELPKKEKGNGRPLPFSFLGNSHITSHKGVGASFDYTLFFIRKSLFFLRLNFLNFSRI